jgi:hypothetical protein
VSNTLFLEDTMRQLRLRTAVIALCGLGSALGAQQAPPGTPAGTGVIAGVLTTADRGEPARKATVRVASTSPRVTRTTTTDAEGRFRITNLPAAEYTLSGLRPGLLEMVYGAAQPGGNRAGTPIRLAPGQTIENISMQLPRGGVIAGVVLDEFGDPAMNVPVRALRLGYRNGERFALPGGTATTDDLGAYRLAGLLPGEYIVTAVPRDTVAAQAAAADAGLIRQAQIQASARAGNPDARAAVATMESAKREGRMPEPPESRGYVPVYYPGTPAAATAGRVQVGLSQQVLGIDMRLQVVETATVSGTLTDMQGSPITGNVQLVDPALPIPSVGVWFRAAAEDGRFSFPGVVPGAYVLRGHNSPPGSIGGAPASGGVFQMSPQMQISVGGAGLSDARVSMTANASVSGKLALDTITDPLNMSSVIVNLFPVTTPADWEMALKRTPPNPDGTFTLTEVVPARYRVQLSGLPAGWTIASAMFGGRDAADYHLGVESGETYTGVVTFTNRTSEITGVLTNALNAPVPRQTILLFPADREQWIPESRRIQVALTGGDGRYAFRGLVKGDYRIAAVTDLEPGQEFDREFLRRLAGASVAITLGEGDRKTQNLQTR